ncbi:MAG TPA: hypothetical protein VJ904_14925 [Tichowtungia sp.]|nr:hypothetical protein [Tichowtungia sp.]
MRKQTVILLIVLILCGAIWLAVQRPAAKPPEAVGPVPEEPPPPVLRSANPSVSAEFDLPEIPALSGSLPELSGKPVRQDTFLDRIMNEQLPALLADKEGSYTRAGELYQSDNPFSVDVQSDWALRYFFPETPLPNLSLRIIQNPETGEYEPAGGALTLPGGAWEAGYEIDPETGENKATLQWKKSF